MVTCLLGLGLALLLLALLLDHLLSRRGRQMLRGVPAPGRLPVIGSIHHLISPSFIGRLGSLVTQYRGFLPCWMGPKLVVFISNPEDIKAVYCSSKALNKSNVYDFLLPILGKEGLFLATEEVWRRNRKLVSPGFHPSIVKSYVPIFLRQANSFTDELEAELGREFDCHIPLMKHFFFSIFETSLDADEDTLKQVHKVIDWAARIMDIMYSRICSPWLHPDFIFYATRLGKEQRALEAAIKGFINAVCVHNEDKWRSSKGVQSGKHTSFIYQMLQSGYKPAEIVDHVITIVSAGFESTGMTAHTTLAMLGAHQDVQARVYRELLEVERGLEGRQPDADTLEQYTYLDLAIKETMRLFPAISITGRRLSEDLELSKCVIPKGTDLYIMNLQAHRNPDYYPDPLKFDPERFLPDRVAQRPPCSFVPFTAGPRMCIGAKYSMMAMKTMLSRVLLRYKIHCSLSIRDLRLRPGIVLGVKGGLPITIEQRS